LALPGGLVCGRLYNLRPKWKVNWTDFQYFPAPVNPHQPQMAKVLKDFTMWILPIIAVPMDICGKQVFIHHSSISATYFYLMEKRAELSLDNISECQCCESKELLLAALYTKSVLLNTKNNFTGLFV
jgi:hypothetical protein